MILQTELTLLFLHVIMKKQDTAREAIALKDLIFKGAGVAIVTPFNEDGIHFAELGRLIDFNIENGTDAIIVTGTTGESATMSDEEHKEAIKFAVVHAGGNLYGGYKNRGRHHRDGGAYDDSFDGCRRVPRGGGSAYAALHTFGRRQAAGSLVQTRGAGACDACASGLRPYGGFVSRGVAAWDRQEKARQRRHVA